MEETETDKKLHAAITWDEACKLGKDKFAELTNDQLYEAYFQEANSCRKYMIDTIVKKDWKSVQEIKDFVSQMMLYDPKTDK